MASGFRSVASRYATAMASGVFALSLLFAAPGYAEEPTPLPNLQRVSLLTLGKPLKAPRSYFLKAACPSYSACCCVIGGYSHCMTSIECAALGGGCTGRC